MYIAQTNSTNSLLREMIVRGEWPAGERYLRAGYQSAGRGQSGNGWESEEGKNLLCSIVMRPCENAFYLNVAVSVAVLRALHRLLPNPAFTVKWPNDIYYGDKKLAGILVESALMGRQMEYAIAGIGLNVNQTVFLSPAPNPVSLKQICGTDFAIDQLMEMLIEETERVESMPESEVWSYYRSHLYRKEGYHPFVERAVDTSPTMNASSQESIEGMFTARIADILATGEIVLQRADGAVKKYHFKQIRYVL